MDKFIRVTSGVSDVNKGKVVGCQEIWLNFDIESNLTERLEAYNFRSGYAYGGSVEGVDSIIVGGNDIEISGEEWRRIDLTYRKLEFLSERYGRVLITRFPDSVFVNGKLAACYKYEWGFLRVLRDFISGGGIGRGLRLGFDCTLNFDSSLVDTEFALAVLIQVGISNGGD